MFITAGPGTKLCAGELEREGHVLRDTVTQATTSSPGRGPGLRGPCVSLFYVNDTGSIGSRGRTVGIPYIYPPP